MCGVCKHYVFCSAFCGVRVLHTCLMNNNGYCIVGVQTVNIVMCVEY